MNDYRLPYPMDSNNYMVSLPLFLAFFSSFFFTISIQAIITKPIIGFCAGGQHACALFDNNKMKCWGLGYKFGSSRNYGSSLSTVGDNLPYFNPGTSLSIKNVGCSGSGTCVVLSSGNIKCLGENHWGQAGIGVRVLVIGEVSGYAGDSLPFVNLGSGVNVTTVVGGRQHHCVLTIDQKVKCFGDGLSGQLGFTTGYIGESPLQMGENLPFLNFGAETAVASIHSGAGAYHSCIILAAPVLSAQRIKCWGLNYYYQLGYGTLGGPFHRFRLGDNLPLVDLGTESRVTQIGAGIDHTCAVLINYGLKCWGRGYDGQLGSGSSATILTMGTSLPYVEVGFNKKTAILSTTSHTNCVVYNDFVRVKCFGWNFYGEGGQEDYNPRGNTPTTKVPFIPIVDLGTGSLKIASIHAGESFYCFVFVDHSVKCIGRNDDGQLAIGSTALAIGDEPNEMGMNLQYSILFSPTMSPTFPTSSPTVSPTSIPTQNPSFKPTSSPTKKCDHVLLLSCKYDSQCIWVGDESSGACFVLNCSLLDDVTCAERSTECKWDMEKNVCKSLKDL